MNRRIFLKNSGMALVAGGLLPNVFVRMAQAGTTKGKKVLVAIFQRGAVDGLNVIVPYAETQ
ncbi:MAG: twin-arginine translocation signal domain-containing protein, partial [Thermoanaerobaculia bacterium]